MAKEDEGHVSSEDKVRLVTVTVDTKTYEVAKGTYVVSDFKKLVGVDTERELVEIKGKKMIPLTDDQEIEIKNGEVFVSHKRTGGSS
jgi:hypothetical protein